MTIVALASGRGRSGVAVIRLSGPRARDCMEIMVGYIPSPRIAVKVSIRHPITREVLDESIALWFPGPASYTGEDVAEFQVHGGGAVISGILEAACCIEGVRIAERGEFTRRAFVNGKMDLLQVEGIADLIWSDTEEQKRQALKMVEGGVSEVYNLWRSKLRDTSAYIEAVIDFPDEELPLGVIELAQRTALSVLSDLNEHLRGSRQAERVREGYYVAILGAPNVGKSSLLNVLVRRDIAIVSEEAGTTRDVVEAHLDLGGLPVVLADTAGLRESNDKIEREGIRRALERADKADLRIIMLEAGRDSSWNEQVSRLINEQCMVVVNKIDISTPDEKEMMTSNDVWPVSVQTGEGIENFLSALEEKVHHGIGKGELPIISRTRHRVAIEECTDKLRRFLAEIGHCRNSSDIRVEVAAEELRLGLRALGRITGQVDIEEVLDVVFNDFCIGK